MVTLLLLLLLLYLPVYISHMPLIYFYRENKNRNLCMEKFKNNKST
jgi:hypothetical protein